MEVYCAEIKKITKKRGYKTLTDHLDLTRVVMTRHSKVDSFRRKSVHEHLSKIES